MIDTAKIAAILLVGIASPSLAQQAADEPEAPEVPAVTQTLADEPVTEEQARADLLDGLFEKLASPQGDEWQYVQNQISSLWNQSGSDSMDFIARRADKAVQEKDYETALVHLDDLVRLAPGYAEGWNKRATVYFLQGEYGASLEDIARTLKLEPRHFGALAGLGVILDRVGDSEGALEAYRRAARIHPNLPGAQDGIKKLTKEVEGQRL